MHFLRARLNRPFRALQKCNFRLLSTSIPGKLAQSRSASIYRPAVEYPPFRSPIASKHLMQPVYPKSLEEMNTQVLGIERDMDRYVLSGNYVEACCLFESRIETHPSIRVQPKIVMLAVLAYDRLNSLENIEEIVNFIEAQEKVTYSIYEVLLKVYTCRGMVSEALEITRRIRQAGYVQTVKMYYLLAKMFAALDDTLNLEKIRQEMEIWMPEHLSTFYSIIARNHLDRKRLHLAQDVMTQMYLKQIGFEPSVFVSLLHLRIEMKNPDAVTQTLKEMEVLKIRPKSDFYSTLIWVLLDAKQVDRVFVILDYMIAHRIKRNTSMYVVLIDKLVKMGEISTAMVAFERHWGDVYAPLNHMSFSIMCTALDGQEDDKLVMVLLERLYETGMIIEPFAITKITLALIEFERVDLALELIKMVEEKLYNGKYPTKPGIINLVCFVLMKYGEPQDAAHFARWTLSKRLPPARMIISVVCAWLRQDLNQREFDLDTLCDLIIEHSSVLQIPTFYSSRLLDLLIEGKRSELAQRLFDGIIGTPVQPDFRRIGNYSRIMEKLAFCGNRKPLVVSDTTAEHQQEDEANSAVRESRPATTKWATFPTDTASQGDVVNVLSEEEIISSEENISWLTPELLYQDSKNNSSEKVCE